MGILKCAAIFTDNMVLQRNKPVKVWGHAYRNDIIEVEVKAAGETVAKATAVAVRNSWILTLHPMEAATGLTMTVKNLNSPEETITFKNVAVGEVWLCGGQSNMEYELQNAKDGAKYIAEAPEKAKAENKDIRFYYTKKYAVNDEFFYIDERSNCWHPIGESMESWSAVGFHFAWEIAETVGCTVGFIGCSWGGTSISNWISLENHKRSASGNFYLDEYNGIMAAKTYEEYLAEVEAENSWFDDWQPKIAEFYSIHYPDHPPFSEAEEYAGEKGHYPGPMGPFSFLRPGGLYETMLSRVAPYTLTGFIYYQGETDDSKPTHYYEMMKLLVDQWRETWDDANLPFIFTQLPMWLPKDGEDIKNWARVRAGQMKAYKFIKNTGLAIITDCGEYDNLHPLDKLPVGHRLALQAKYLVYGVIPADKANGPQLRYTRPIDHGIELYFDYADDGFEILDKPNGPNVVHTPTYTFEIATANGKFIEPTEVILDKGKVTLTNPAIKTCAEYARYNFSNFCEVPLFGKNNLPLAPFNTFED
jgi:sialate O-acetylesterase